ncbi:Non-structural maintenance of chromosomes like protein [Argiope bruennichi]|uniref:Non-structural maintenance of chromosomes element 1 homolog n=2 Tax=Argiope bruennichi TaxID=94029 RepID=A0A8T0EZQ9_ARGBR|nr:Non-structural maintenance of chromosomes like protein [Argiope bruennichi]
MWKKICGNDEVWNLIRKCQRISNDDSSRPETPEPEDLVQFIKEINLALKPLNIAIKSMRDELSTEMFYILINENNNNISRLASDYKMQELEVFKGLAISIVKSEDGKISSTDALNLEIDIKISKREVNDMLQMFVVDGWLCEKDGYYFFSTRAIAELQHFFRENYMDNISICYQCKNIVFQGPVCQNCDIKLHNYCMKRTGIKLCPSCRKDFYVS